jgi:hypothetical protein
LGDLKMKAFKSCLENDTKMITWVMSNFNFHFTQ